MTIFIATLMPSCNFLFLGLLFSVNASLNFCSFDSGNLELRSVECNTYCEKSPIKLTTYSGESSLPINMPPTYKVKEILGDLVPGWLKKP